MIESLTARVGPGLEPIPPISGAGSSRCLGAEMSGSSVKRLTGAGVGPGFDLVTVTVGAGF